jgi:hypothetical protein
MSTHEDLTPAEQQHASERDAQSNMNMDDINIPLVAVSVLFFGVLLAVTIAGLQAWFYHQQTAIREANTLPRDYYVPATAGEIEKGTELGMLWHKQRMELHDPAHATSRPAAVSANTSAPATPTPKRITIDEAIAALVRDGEK